MVREREREGGREREGERMERERESEGRREGDQKQKTGVIDQHRLRMRSLTSAFHTSAGDPGTPHTKTALDVSVWLLLSLLLPVCRISLR